MICWYCHWGWSKPVGAIHDKYEAIAGEPAKPEKYPPKVEMAAKW